MSWVPVDPETAQLNKGDIVRVTYKVEVPPWIDYLTPDKITDTIMQALTLIWDKAITIAPQHGFRAKDVQLDIIEHGKLYYIYIILEVTGTSALTMIFAILLEIAVILAIFSIAFYKFEKLVGPGGVKTTTYGILLIGGIFALGYLISSMKK